MANAVPKIASKPITSPVERISGPSIESTTAPVALGISESVGGLPALTAVLVILTGIIGAVMVTPLMNLLRITDWRARGFAVGLAAHGIGTARALQDDPVTGAYAGLGLATNALATAVLVPVLFTWLPPLARLVP